MMDGWTDEDDWGILSGDKWDMIQPCVLTAQKVNHLLRPPGSCLHLQGPSIGQRCKTEQGLGQVRHGKEM